MRLLLILILLKSEALASDPFSTDTLPQSFWQPTVTAPVVIEQTYQSDSEPEVLHFEIHQLCQFCNTEIIIDPYEDIRPKFTDEE